MDRSKVFVKSAGRVLDILDLLSAYPQGLGIQEISENLRIPQSSTFNLIQTLYSKGYIHECNFKKYKLSPKLIELGTGVIESLDFHAQAQTYLQDLSKKINETVFMAVLSDEKVVYIAKIDSSRSIRTNVQVGSKKPLYCTALGKIFLSHFPEDKRRNILSSEMVAFTKQTITVPEKLEEQVPSILKNGYSLDNQEIEEGLRCVAAPIYDRNSFLIAAISISGPNERMSIQHDFIVTSLIETAMDISSALGYRRATN